IAELRAVRTGRVHVRNDRTVPRGFGASALARHGRLHNCERRSVARLSKSCASAFEKVATVIRMSKLLRPILALTFVVTVFGALQPVARADGLPTVVLAINGHKVTAEVAATPEERATGLMNRFSLRPDNG